MLSPDDAPKVAGMGHVAFRATSPEALERRAAVIDAAGFGHGWTDGDLGHGRAFSFGTTDGHRMEIYYEAERYLAPESLRPALKNQPQRNLGRGVAVSPPLVAAEPELDLLATALPKALDRLAAQS